MNNVSGIKVGGLQQQNTISSSTPFSQEQESEGTLLTQTGQMNVAWLPGLYL